MQASFSAGILGDHGSGTGAAAEPLTHPRTVRAAGYGESCFRVLVS
jgi:hypothetical protein